MASLHAEVQRKLDEFCNNSNKVAARTSDFERWENFIIACHEHDVAISNWIYDHLVVKGFEEDIAFAFYNQFRIARNVLNKKGA